jgi:hypothetical protein
LAIGPPSSWPGLHLALSACLAIAERARQLQEAGHLAELAPLAGMLGQSLHRLHLEVNAYAKWLADRAEPTAVVEAPSRTCRLAVQGDTIFLDGQPTALKLSKDKREDAALYLHYLIEANGGIVSDGDINQAEERRCTGRQGVRWDRLRQQLPDQVKALVKTTRRGSYLIDACWRK